MLSAYHKKYLNRSLEDIKERIMCKEHELKQIFNHVSIPKKSNYKIAVLGCGVKYFVSAHKAIFKKLLNAEVDITTFEINIEHLKGEEGIVKHDCTLPLPNTPYDIIYSSVLLKFIPTEKQIDVLINSYNALNGDGMAIHLLGNEESNKIDTTHGYNDVPLQKLREKFERKNIKFIQIDIFTGPKLNFKELAWIFIKE